MGYGDPFFFPRRKPKAKRRWTWWMESRMVVIVVLWGIAGWLLWPALWVYDRLNYNGEPPQDGKDDTGHL